MKKALSIVLIVTMLLGVMALAVSADDVDTTVPKVVYEQNFDGVTDVSTLGWAMTGNDAAVMTVENGKLVIDNTAAGATDCFMVIYDKLPTNLKEFSVEVEMTLLGKADGKDTVYGAPLAYYTDPHNYVGFWVRMNGAFNFQVRRPGATEGASDSYTTVGKLASGVAKENVASLTPALESSMNVALNLKLDFHGYDVLGGYTPGCDAYINGQKVYDANYDLGTLTSNVALLVKGGAKVSFDNIKVTQNAFLTGNEPKPMVLPERGEMDWTKTSNFEMVIYDEDLNPDSKPYGMWKAGESTPLYLSDIDCTFGACTGTNVPTKDGPYKNPGAGITLAQTLKYEKGMGVHPTSDKAYGYIVYDIGQYTDANGSYKYDTLYSIVGLTNSASKGVVFAVYGDKGAGFEKLACSDLMVLYNIGEFNVDITGVTRLLLVFNAPNGYGSSGCAWGDLAIFKADPNAVKPSYAVVKPAGTVTDESAKVTDEATAAVTDAANTSAATEAGTKAPDNEVKEIGCASSVALSSALALVLIGGCAIMLRKKD